MTTPQQQGDRKSTSPSVPTSPIEDVKPNLSQENAEFYSIPSILDSKNPVTASTPSQDANTLNLQSKPKVSTTSAPNQLEQGITAETEDFVVTTTVPAAIQPDAIEAALATPVMDSSIEAPIEDNESDTEMMDAPDTLSDMISSAEVDMIEGAPKENGVKLELVFKEKTQRERISELEQQADILRNSLDETVTENQSLAYELNRTKGICYDLQRQYGDLQQKLEKKDRDYEVMSKNYLEHVRLIRATDDDHSTIMDRLTQLKASIEHLIRKAQGGRSVNLNKDVAVGLFKESGLLETFPVPEDKLESYHLNLYMESVVMKTLVDSFFSKSLSSIFDYNKGFKEIYEWMKERNEKLAVRWRQQLCVMLAQGAGTKARQEAEVKTVAEALSEIISKVYTNANELNKIKDICNKAFDLALAMTAQENVINPVAIPLGTPFDEEKMGTSLKSNPEGKVALVIFPAFVDESNAFDIRPKVWCY
ncbi:hypothetical protein BGZ76_004255 [Entomortierella beljakovae]|nr:hypothetical protein BGZ76_004255 [Entomortierella beljakovae]